MSIKSSQPSIYNFSERNFYTYLDFRILNKGILTNPVKLGVVENLGMNPEGTKSAVPLALSNIKVPEARPQCCFLKQLAQN